MNAYDFIAKLLKKIRSADTVFGVELKEGIEDVGDGIFQWIGADYCTVKPGKVILGLSIADDDLPEENRIDTIYKLQRFFIKNNVSKNDKIYIYPTGGVVLLKNFTTTEYNGVTSIVCDCDIDSISSYEDL